MNIVLRALTVLLLALPLAGQSVVPLSGVLLGTPPPGLDAVVAALNTKLRADLGVTLQLSYIGWNELNAKYPLVLAAGEGVDFIYTANWAPYSTQAVRGAFRELTPEQLRTNMPRHWAATPAEAWQQARVGGRIFMVPTATPDQKVPVAVIRGDLRRRYGLAPIHAVSDLEPYLSAVKLGEPNLVPINLGSGYDIGQPFFALLNPSVPPIGAPFFGTVYGNYEDPHHGLVNLLDEPWRSAFRQAAVTMKRWRDLGYVNRAPFANTVLSKQSFALGRSAVGFGNSQDIQPILAVAQERGYEPELIPILSRTGHSWADSYTGNGVAVASGSQHPELVLKVLDLLMEDPSYINLVTFGVEGRHWRWTPDGKVGLPANVRAEDHPYPLESGGFWFVNKTKLPALESWSTSYLSFREHVATLLVPNQFLGFAFVPSAVRNEVAAITQAMAQYGDVLSIGAVANVDKALRALQNQLNAAHQDRVLAELRRQLAAYEASTR